jgi:hypothetical protein
MEIRLLGVTSSGFATPLALALALRLILVGLASSYSPPGLPGQ